MDSGVRDETIRISGERFRYSIFDDDHNTDDISYRITDRFSQN